MHGKPCKRSTVSLFLLFFFLCHSSVSWKDIVIVPLEAADSLIGEWHMGGEWQKDGQCCNSNVAASRTESFTPVCQTRICLSDMNPTYHTASYIKVSPYFKDVKLLLHLIIIFMERGKLRNLNLATCLFWSGCLISLRVLVLFDILCNIFKLPQVAVYKRQHHGIKLMLGI